MLRKIYRFSYVTGTVLVIVSMLMTIMPVFPVFAAQGSTKTSSGSCANPVNKNHYVSGDVIVLDFQGFEPNSTHNWTITGNPGGSSGDPNIVVASGTFTVDANGDFCVDNAYVIQPDDWGEYTVKVDGSKGDAYRVNQEPAPGDLNVTVSKTPSVSSVQFPGDSVTFTVVITNNESFDLAISQTGDSIFTDIGSCAFSAITKTLPANTSITCTFTGYVSGPAGSDHVNTFTVGATNGQQTTIVNDNAVVAILPLPDLVGSVQKTANPTTVQAPGGSVTFTVSVTNSSVEAVTLNTLTDSVFGNLNNQGDCSVPQTIAANGGTYTCSFPGSVTGNVGDVHSNTVTAGVSMSDQTANWQDSATVDVVAGPSLSMNVSKSASPSSVVEPGENVSFTFTVENTSNVEVSLDSLIDTVFDDLDGQGTCVLPQTLAIGASYSCSLTSFINSPHSNTVTASISHPGEDDVTGSASAVVSYTERPLPVISVVKTANPAAVDETGGNVTYTVAMTNLSGFSVNTHSLLDNKFGDLNGEGTCSEGVAIAAGETYTCTFTRFVSGPAGTTHENTVTGQAIDSTGEIATDSDNASVFFNALPTILVSKTASSTSISELGESVTFTVVVSNTANETVWLTSLNDSVFGNLNGTGTCSVTQLIAVGNSYQCSFTSFLVGDPGTPHINVVTAIAEDSDSNQTQASDNETVNFQDLLPTIVVTKLANPTSVDEPGGPVTFTVQVENTSGEAVTLNSLSDSIYGDLSSLGTCAVGVPIASGATFSCNFTENVTGNAGELHTNVVQASVSDNDNNSASGSDDATVSITDVPTVVEVIKTAFPTAVVEPGGDVTFTIQVNNITIEQITLVSLQDDLFGDLNGMGDCAVPQTIAVSGNYSCSFTTPVNGEAGYVHINTVTATAQDNDGGSAQDTDSAQVDVLDVEPTIQVIKTANPISVPAPNATVSFTVEVVNNSAESVTLDSLVDDMFGDLNGAGNCLVGGLIQPGESYSCTFNETISGQNGETHTNVIEASVSDNEGNSTTNEDDAVVTFTAPPQIVLVDPCTVGCDLPNVTGEICNGSPDQAYNGRITWAIFVDTTQIGNGTIFNIPADTCVDVSAPRQGNGLYSVSVNFVDENRTVETSCGPLSCSQPTVTPTPVPPVNPPTGTPTVFIPVTGFDFSLNGLISMIQNLGFALVSIGLVLHGLSLNDNKKKSKG